MSVQFFVFSHLRWNFVFQRPQHLFTRCARQHAVTFWEEPVFRDGAEGHLTIANDNGVAIVVPELPAGTTEDDIFRAQAILLNDFCKQNGESEIVAWYYTPLAVNFSRHLPRVATVYDCMDELSAFRGAPPGLAAAEKELFASADLVFTGGESLYESKRTRHSSVHLFPSSIDHEHFMQARHGGSDPDDQARLARPRLGYCGVIDERMDLELLDNLARLRPTWQLVMIGPIAKISDSDLPRADNIHYLGPKSYGELPAYLAGWDIALMPFARNESTRYISPTKTPEYLAAGRPVISTPIRDVVRPYGQIGAVEIAENADEFVAAAERILANQDAEREAQRLRRIDTFLAQSSWDRTWSEMQSLVRRVASENGAPPIPAAELGFLNRAAELQ